ncbi:TetR/AcrR family transcriptional regulator [Flindersiella endophytica]
MLDAAVAVFAQRGYHETSMDDIADQAGISKPMVYLYLGSKEALFARCLEQESHRLLTAIAEAVDAELRPDEQLWRALHAVFTVVSEHRDGWNVLHRQGTKATGALGERAAGLRDQTVEVVRQLLAKAWTTGRRRKAHAEELQMCAYALVGAAESVADWLADHPEVTPEVAARRLMTISWVGLGDIMNGEIWRPSGRSNRTA